MHSAPPLITSWGNTKGTHTSDQDHDDTKAPLPLRGEPPISEGEVQPPPGLPRPPRQHPFSSRVYLRCIHHCKDHDMRDNMVIHVEYYIELPSRSSRETKPYNKAIACLRNTGYTSPHTPSYNMSYSICVLMASYTTRWNRTLPWCGTSKLLMKPTTHCYIM